MKSTSFIFFAILILTFLVSSSKPSLLLPFIDPFGVLEQTPFDLHKEHRDVVPAARVDWKETEEGHVMRVDVPGLKKEEVNIEVDEENRILRVMGERKREEEEKGEHWHRLERSYGKFVRQFRLANDVDLESVRAKLHNGVLTLTLPKLSPDKIKVKGPTVVTILDEEPPAAQPNSGQPKLEL